MHGHYRAGLRACELALETTGAQGRSTERARALNAFLTPIRQRRAQYEAQPGLVDDILSQGTQRMRAEAEDTMTLVREAMGLDSRSKRVTTSIPVNYQ